MLNYIPFFRQQMIPSHSGLSSSAIHEIPALLDQKKYFPMKSSIFHPPYWITGQIAFFFLNGSVINPSPEALLAQHQRDVGGGGGREEHLSQLPTSRLTHVITTVRKVTITPTATHQYHTARRYDSAARRTRRSYRRRYLHTHR